MPAVENLYKTFLKENNIQVIGISQFDTTEVDSIRFVNKYNLTFPNIYDPNSLVADLYNIDGVPSYVFIDKTGHIESRSSGAYGVELIRSRLHNLVNE